VLRPVRADDATAVHAYRGDPAVVAYLTHPPLDLAQVRHRLSRAETAWSSAGEGRFDLLFAVLLDGAVVGDVRARSGGEQGRPVFAGPSAAWIDYAFDPRFGGHGYATEAVRCLLGWLFGHVGTVYADLYDDNVRSLRLLRRLGFCDDHHLTADEDESGKHLASTRVRVTRARLLQPAGCATKGLAADGAEAPHR